MLTDLESKMGTLTSHVILLRTQLEEAKKERDGAKPLLEKIQAAEKRLKMTERCGFWYCEVRPAPTVTAGGPGEAASSSRAARREQEAELMDLRAQVGS